MAAIDFVTSPDPNADIYRRGSPRTDPNARVKYVTTPDPNAAIFAGRNKGRAAQPRADEPETAAAVVASIPFLVGAAPAIGVLGWIVVNFPCRISGAFALADASCSFEVDVKTTDYAGFPGSLASICGGVLLTVASAQKGTRTRSEVEAAWSVTLSRGAILQYELTSATPGSALLYGIYLRVRRLDLEALH